MSNLNGIDYFLIFIFGFSFFVGFSRGLIKEVVSLIALVAAFAVATLYSNQLALQFTSNSAVQGVVSDASSAIGVSAAAPVSYAAVGVSFAIIFAGTLLLGSLVGLILNLFFTVGFMGTLNRLLGAVFGLIRGFIINLVLIFVIQLTVVGNQPAWHQSQIVTQYQPAVAWLNGIVTPGIETLKEKAGGSLQDMSGKIQNIVK